MLRRAIWGAAATAAALALFSAHVANAEALLGPGTVDRVLVISIDGMHAVDFQNCASGVPPIEGGAPYCPHMAALAQRGVTYQQATTSKPSDSFPGLTAIVTGGSPRSTGAFYDVSYDRSLSPPAKTTPYGIVGGADLCPRVVGTQIGFDEEIDNDLTRLDAGGGINPAYLPRDPRHGCAPVYPHSFIRVNTLFEVVKAAGGYTAWSDKHQSYELVKGQSGLGVDDFYAPEINSIPVPLPQVTLTRCNPLPDQTAVASSNSWTDSFANIRCYDSLKVQAILNEINGLRHDGTVAAPVPTVFGMNFQAVSVGEKLIENSVGLTGGYTDPYGVPTASLLDEIKFVDHSIGLMVNALQSKGLLSRTLIIISAKHGQSPTDPKRVLRIPADNASMSPPSAILSPSGVGPGFAVVQALEDDVSLIWLSENNLTQTAGNVALLEAHANQIGAGGGQIYAGPPLNLLFNDPAIDPRTPNIIVTPDVGTIYTGGKKKLAEHGGFAHDDTNVMLLVAHPSLTKAAISTPVATAQIAPTVLAALGLSPSSLLAVREEGTPVLPALQH